MDLRYFTMAKTVLITGATDGIGLVTAQTLVDLGHTLLIHGRNEAKLKAVEEQLISINPQAHIETYLADFSNLNQVAQFTHNVLAKHSKLDVLINNAGVFKTAQTITAQGLDVRFVVNTIAPYLITRKLLTIMHAGSRVVNVSSAAQAPLKPEEIVAAVQLDDGAAYAKSKLAIIMWTKHLANTLASGSPTLVSVNPASFLGSKMVKQAYGVAGGDLQIGADILIKAALSEKFTFASGKYFDNDVGRFTSPHPDAEDVQKVSALTQQLDSFLSIFFD
jgi:NAD(P)-dependent dehydrogenase (short-subunit alcohol dehydrogenase family)